MQSITTWLKYKTRGFCFVCKSCGKAFTACLGVGFMYPKVYTGIIIVMIITNIVSMWMMVDAARTLADIQDSCLLVTNRRVFGKAGKEINLYYRDIQRIENTPVGVFIKSEMDHRSVMIRNLRNKEEFYQALRKHI